MVFGYNTEVLCGNMRFHVQTEDRGPSNPIIETLVYRQGEIVTSMRHNYSALLGHQELEKEVKAAASPMSMRSRRLVAAPSSRNSR